MKNNISILRKDKDRFLSLYTCVHICIFITNWVNQFRFLVHIFPGVCGSTCTTIKHLYLSITVNQLLFTSMKFIERFARALWSPIFLAANQSLAYGCNKNMGMDKAWSQKLFVANQFISGKSRNNSIQFIDVTMLAYQMTDKRVL